MKNETNKSDIKQNLSKHEQILANYKNFLNPTIDPNNDIIPTKQLSIITKKSNSSSILDSKLTMDEKNKITHQQSNKNSSMNKIDANDRYKDFMKENFESKVAQDQQDFKDKFDSIRKDTYTGNDNVIPNNGKV